jgi:hypothetical protein
MDEAGLLRELLATEKLDEVRALIDEYVESQSGWVSWRPVGDRTNNSGTIQAAGDPGRAILERITNGIDAVIELQHNEHHGNPECSSPKEAAQAWFGVPSAGMHKMSPGAQRKLAQASVTLRLLPGDGRAKRAVIIADKGTGLAPDQIPATILSLNADNKMSKFYLAGAFGQGGSATFASSDYTLVASRSVKSPGTVGFTVVKLQPPQGIKLGTYVYLVRDGKVLTSSPPEAFEDFSTIVKHFGYDLDDYPSPVGPNSLYGRAQAILFEPVLPFWFENRVHEYNRTIKGSRTALNGAKVEDGEEESKLTHTSPIFFADLGEFGRIGIEYWVLEPSAKSAPNKGFVNGAKPIVLTVNGQTHAEWSATILRKSAGLMHLASRMVVHLDCNDISPDAKRVLFVSNREESRKGQVQNLILTELLGALKSDDRLTELEEEARLAGTKEKDENAEKEVRREVARMLKLFGFSVAEPAGATKTAKGESGTTATGMKKTKTKPEPIQLNEPPSFIELVGDDPITFYAGQRRYIRLRTDAHSKYHDATDPLRSRLSFLVDGDVVRLAGSTELRDGHMRIVLAATEGATVGARGKLTVELRPLNSPTLTSFRDIEIVAEPPAKTSAAKINLPNIDIEPVDEVESEEWVGLGWPNDIDAVAADYVYLPTKDILQIRYSTLFPRFRTVREQFASKDKTSAGSFETRYRIWLTTNVLIHWQDTQGDATKPEDSDLDAEMLDDYRRDELRRMAKASTIYAQREVTQGSQTQLLSGD